MEIVMEKNDKMDGLIKLLKLIDSAPKESQADIVKYLIGATHGILMASTGSHQAAS